MKLRMSWMIVTLLAALILVFTPQWAVAADSPQVKPGISQPEWIWSRRCLVPIPAA